MNLLHRLGLNRLGTLLPLLIFALLVYVPLGGWRHLHGGQAGDDPAERTYGAAQDVPGFAWAVVLNTGGVRTADGHIDFFEPCMLRYRGIVREVTSHFSFYTWWNEAVENDVLVEYDNPPDSRAVGTLCPDGAVFLLPREEWRTYSARTAERRAYEARLAAEVQDALADPRPGRAHRVAESLRWVEALNPTGLENYGYRIGFLEACGIEAGGTVRPVSETSLGTLYTYDPDPRTGFRGVGIPCPADTAFLLEDTARRTF